MQNIEDYKQKVIHFKKWIGTNRAAKMLHNASLAEQAKKIFDDDEEIRKHLLSLIPGCEAKKTPNFQFYHTAERLRKYYANKAKINWLSHSHAVNLFRDFNRFASHMKYVANQVHNELKCDYIYILNLFIDKILLMIKNFAPLNNYLIKY